MPRDAHSLHSLIGAGLQRELAGNSGDRYVVKPGYITSVEPVFGTPILNPPDFVVADAATHDVFFIELKGSDPSTDLPLSSSSALRVYSSQFPTINPHVILVSGSYVPPILAAQLQDDGIILVDATKAANVVAQVASAIEGAPSRKTKTGRARLSRKKSPKGEGRTTTR